MKTAPLDLLASFAYQRGYRSIFRVGYEGISSTPKNPYLENSEFFFQFQAGYRAKWKELSYEIDNDPINNAN